jgi:hypothetical protein
MSGLRRKAGYLALVCSRAIRNACSYFLGKAPAILPPTVTTDSQAFEKILGRLEGEVGTILRLIPTAKANGLWRDTGPLWSPLRIMFPVAESLADLIYDKDHQTALNLKDLLQKEFEAVRPGRYQGKAAIVALLFSPFADAHRRAAWAA